MSSRCIPLAFALSSLFGLGACGVSGELQLHGRGSAALCDDAQLGLAINSTGKVPDGCTKIEGGQIGQLPQTLQIDGGEVTLTGWTAKTDDPGDRVGFTFTSTVPVKYAVKAGTRTFVDTTPGWVHPEGTSGPLANGISNITFCPDGEGGGTSTPDAGEPADAGSGGGGGECLPDPVDAGTVNPCVQDADCGPSEICVAGTCQPQIG